MYFLGAIIPLPFINYYRAATGYRYPPEAGTTLAHPAAAQPKHAFQPMKSPTACFKNR